MSHALLCLLVVWHFWAYGSFGVERVGPFLTQNDCEKVRWELFGATPEVNTSPCLRAPRG